MCDVCVSVGRISHWCTWTGQVDHSVNVSALYQELKETCIDPRSENISVSIGMFVFCSWYVLVLSLVCPCFVVGMSVFCRWYVRVLPLVCFSFVFGMFSFCRWCVFVLLLVCSCFVVGMFLFCRWYGFFFVSMISFFVVGIFLFNNY